MLLTLGPDKVAEMYLHHYSQHFYDTPTNQLIVIGKNWHNMRDAIIPANISIHFTRSLTVQAKRDTGPLSHYAAISSSWPSVVISPGVPRYHRCLSPGRSADGPLINCSYITMGPALSELINDHPPRRLWLWAAPKTVGRDGRPAYQSASQVPQLGVVLPRWLGRRKLWSSASFLVRVP